MSLLFAFMAWPYLSLEAKMDDQRQNALSISRRGFVQSAIGSLIVLPAVNGVGIFSMQRVAHAAGLDAQPGTAFSNEEYAKITVVTRDEVGIVVIDVAKGPKAFVPGAKVKITSRYAQLTKRYDKDYVEGITDEEGKIIFNIKELAENVDYQPLDEIDPYEFNGTIEVTCDGYRTFETALFRVRGAAVITASTRSIQPDDPAPYPHMVSYNEWDILYCENQFLLTTENNRDQEIAFEGRYFDSGECTLILREQGTLTEIMTTTATPKDGVLKASMTHKFGLLGGDRCLKKETSYEIAVVQGKLTYVWPLQIVMGEGQFQKNIEGNLDFNPFMTGKSVKWGLSFTWPEKIPLFGGSQFDFGNIITLPLNLAVDPFGFAQLTMSLPVYGYVNDNGDKHVVRWNQDPVVGPLTQWQKYTKRIGESWKDSTTKMGEKPFWKKTPLFKQIDIQLFLQFLGAFDVRDHHIFRGTGVAQLDLNVAVVVTQQFFAGPVPLLASFNFDASAILAAMFQMHTEPVDPGKSIIDQLKDLSCWTVEPSGVNFTFTLTLAPALSFGVGIRGIASLSVRFKIIFVIALMLPVSALWEEDEFKGKSPTHFTVKAEFYLQVVVQFFFASNTWTIPPKIPKWTIYDNWKGVSDPDVEAEADGSQMPLADFVGRMKLVTNAMLGHSVEVKALGGQSDLSTQSLATQSIDDALDDQKVLDWSKVRCDDEEHTLADGNTVTYAVYRFPGLDEALGKTAEGEDRAQTQGMPAKGKQSSASADLQGFQLASEGVPGASCWHHGNSTRYAKKRMTCMRTSPDGLFTQAETDGFLPEPGVKEVKNTGGVRPTSDVIISTDENGNPQLVYSDPHIKVLDTRTAVSTAEGVRATCAFRIGTVEVAPGVRRSRLLMTVLDANGSFAEYIGMQSVIDFDIARDDVNREDLFDYEYGLAFSSSTKKTGTVETSVDQIEIVLVSGKRAAGDDTPVAAAASDLYFTYLRFQAEDLVKDVPEWSFALTIPGNQLMNPDGVVDTKSHCISNINCVCVEDDSNNKSLLVAYLDRCAEKPEDVFSDDREVVTANPGFIFFQTKDGINGQTEVKVPDSETVIKRNPFPDPTVLRITLSPKIQGRYTLSLQGRFATIFLLLTFDAASNAFSSVAWCPMVDSTLALVPWPQQDCFLTSFASEEYRQTEEYEQGAIDHSKWDRSKWVLQKATWVYGPESSLNILKFEPIGPDNFNFSRFALNSAGTFIFWPEGRPSSDEYVHDVYGNETVTGQDEPLNQIRACRVRANADGSLHFSDPFVAADVSHSIDSLEVVATFDRYAPFEVLTTELVDTGERTIDNMGEEVPLYSASYLWYTSVPNLQCATVVASSCTLPLVSAGGWALFDITIRNDGNSFLSGCKVCMFVHDLEVDSKGEAVRDENGDYIDKGVQQVGEYFDLEFNADTLQESPFDPKDGSGNFMNEEPDFALPPGKRSIYRVKVAIPAEWADVKYVSFHAKDPIMAEGGGLAAQDDDDPVFQPFAVEPGTYPVIRNRTSAEQSKSQRFMSCLNVAATQLETATYADSPGTVYETGTRPTPASGSGDGANSGGNSTKGSVAKTGDTVPWGLLAGVGAAGAAMAAYTKRRLENEKAAAGESSAAAGESGDQEGEE